jgi:hypothetical protein
VPTQRGLFGESFEQGKRPFGFGHNGELSLYEKKTLKRVKNNDQLQTKGDLGRIAM